MLDEIYDYLGLVGGIILSISLLPQIFKVCRTKSARDLSFGWQVVALTGLICLTVYGFGKDLWPIYSTVIIEMTLIISLMLLKVYFDCWANNNNNNGDENGAENV